HDRLEHYRDRLLSGSAFYRVEVVVGDVHETAGQRLEGIGVLGLAARGDGGEGAAVERALGRDDLERAVSVPGAPLSDELDGGLVGLGSGVAEEDSGWK